MKQVKSAFGYTLENVLSPVSSYLVLGGRPRTADLLEFRNDQQHPITHIINCLPIAEEEAIEHSFRASGQLLQLNLLDGGHDFQLRRQLPSIIEFVRSARKNLPSAVVYVHCQSGVNRAPSVALAILISEERCSLLNALEWMYKARPAIRPKYIKEIAVFEKQQLGISSVPALLDGVDSNGILEIYIGLKLDFQV